MSFQSAALKIKNGERLEKEDAAVLLAHLNLTELGILAEEVRFRLWPDRVVTYTIGGCLGFAPKPGATGKQQDSPEGVVRQAGLLVERGGAEICLFGLPERSPGLGDYLELFDSLKRDSRARVLTRCLGVSEILRLSEVESLPPQMILSRLKDAGLEILRGEEIGPASPAPAPFFDWLEVHHAAHHLGIPSTAVVPSGWNASSELLEYLERIRRLQEETGLFLALGTGPLGRREHGDPMVPVPGSPSSFQYLRLLAVCRCFLHNIPHLQSAWETQGTKIAGVALRFGSNDLGSTGTTSGESPHPRLLLPPSEMERLIRDIGFRPWLRNGLFERLTTADYLERQSLTGRQLPLVS